MSKEKIQKKISIEPNQVNNTEIQEEYVVNGFSRFQLKRLPKTFTEGNTNVKIAFVESHVNCRKYDSKTGLTFEGCFKFNHFYTL